MAKREHRRTNQASSAGTGDSTRATARRRRLRLPTGAWDEATRASTLRSLEAAKARAFERGDVTAALRAIEQQGRILGLFGTSSNRDPCQSADEALIAEIAVDHADLAAILRAYLERGGPTRA